MRKRINRTLFFSMERCFTMVVKVIIEECVGCGACEDVCPNQAITVDDVAVIDANKCDDCGTCIEECPSEALAK
jgi:ferredoxin